MPAKFEVRVFSRLELLAFNAHNLQGHVTVTTPPVRKFFQGSCRDDAKFTKSRDPGHAPFYTLLTFGGWRPPNDIV